MTDYNSAEASRKRREDDEEAARKRRRDAEASETNYAQEVTNGLIGIPSSGIAIAIDIATPGGLF